MDEIDREFSASRALVCPRTTKTRGRVVFLTGEPGALESIRNGIRNHDVRAMGPVCKAPITHDICIASLYIRAKTAQQTTST